MNTLTQEMIQFRSVPDDQKVKIKAGLIREELSQKALYAGVSMAAAAALGWIADNMPISFEERKNIDTILSSLQNGLKQNKIQQSVAISDLLKIAKHYQG